MVLLEKIRYILCDHPRKEDCDKTRNQLELLPLTTIIVVPPRL